VTVTLSLSDALSLDPLSRAALAVALDAAGDVTDTQALLASIRETAIKDAMTVHWPDAADEAAYSRSVMGSTLRTTAMAADTLARLDPESPLLPGAIHWLMGQRQGLGWGDTQKTGFAILALTDYLLATQEPGQELPYQIYVNDSLWQAGRLEAALANPTLVLTYHIDSPAETNGVGQAIAPAVPITPSATLTTSKLLTATEGITVGETTTTSDAITAVEATTTSLPLTTSQVISAPEAVTVTKAVTATEAVTATGAIAVSAASSLALLRPGQNEIRLVLSTPGEAPQGYLYYAISVTAQRAPREGAFPASQSHQRSIAVEREYTSYNATGPSDSFQHGDLVRVRLTLDVPAETWYVLVDDPLPAGFEASNESLGATSHLAAAYEEPVFSWEEYGYNRKQVRDERVTFFVDQLAPGLHTYTYLIRATSAGSFTAMPTQVYPMYEPEVWSRSESIRLQVETR
jgi:hypothetical protein